MKILCWCYEKYQEPIDFDYLPSCAARNGYGKILILCHVHKALLNNALNAAAVFRHEKMVDLCLKLGAMPTQLR